MLPNFNLVSSDAATPVVTEFIGPDNAALAVSDYFLVSQNATRIRFTRPTASVEGFEHCAPGSRVRFRTNSPYIRLHLNYSGLVSFGTYNGTGSVLSNGVRLGGFNKGSPGELLWSYYFGSSSERDIEVTLPYLASVDFEGVDVEVGSTFAAPTARTAQICVGGIDSITHGFNVSAEYESWLAKLCRAKGWQVRNHGYGGRELLAVDGTTIGQYTTTRAIVLAPYNNFYAQQDLTTFQGVVASFIANFRAAAPLARLYLVTCTWSPNAPGPPFTLPGSNTLEQYRQKMRDAVTAAGDPLVTLIEGVPLATNSTASFPDGIHPNDAGATEIATALAAVTA